MIEYRFMTSRSELRDGDIASLNALLRALTPRDVRATHETVAQLLYRAQLLVARDISREGAAPIVGMGTMNLVTTLSENYGYVDDVAVLPSHERQGIATEIARRLIEQARNLGLAYVELSSAPHRAGANHIYRDKLKGELRDTNVYRWRFWEPDAE